MNEKIKIGNIFWIFTFFCDSMSLEFSKYYIKERRSEIGVERVARMEEKSSGWSNETRYPRKRSWHSIFEFFFSLRRYLSCFSMVFFSLHLSLDISHCPFLFSPVSWGSPLRTRFDGVSVCVFFFKYTLIDSRGAYKCLLVSGVLSFSLILLTFCATSIQATFHPHDFLLTFSLSLSLLRYLLLPSPFPPSLCFFGGWV